MRRRPRSIGSIADGEPTLEPILREVDEIAVPAMVLGEYRYGIMQSRERVRYERWLVESISSYRVLPVDEGTAEQYGSIRGEFKRKVWIAALARRHSLPLLSRDRVLRLRRRPEAPWLVVAYAERHQLVQESV